jgi:hypothetical protein
MLINLTQNQLEQIIEALEKDVDKPDRNHPLKSYLKSIKNLCDNQSIELDEIPF